MRPGEDLEKVEEDISDNMMLVGKWSRWRRRVIPKCSHAKILTCLDINVSRLFELK